MRRLLTIEHLQNAYHSLKLTRTRTILTTVGITIGVASITSILALGSGINHTLGKQIDQLGGNLAVIRPKLPGKDVNVLTSPVTQHAFATSPLTESDYESILKLPGVESAAPIMTISGSLRADKTTVNDAVVLSTTPSFIDTATVPTKDGQFIDSVTSRDTAVIGHQIAIDLFGTELPIGQTFELRGQTFTVIGIMKKMQNPINYNNVDLDNAVIISLESGKSLHHGMAQIQQINIKAKNADDLTHVVNSIEQQLAKNHRDEKDYSVIYGKDVASPTGKLYETIASVMAAIAAISLVVGGIGIMNIMLVGVAERTREIGLRKAVGASHANIIAQFLAESLIMSTIGGIVGVFFGYLIATAMGASILLIPELDWSVVAVGMAVSLIVGTVFGLYPALRAARKDPIESLRHYH